MSKILGVKIDELSLPQVIAQIAVFLKSKKFHQIVTINPEFIVRAQRDRQFKKVLNHSDLSIPDGFGLQLAALVNKVKIGERLTGVDLTWELAKIAAEKGFSIFLLGGKNNAALKTSKRLKLLYPKLNIAGYYEGNPDEKGIYEKIINAKTDILLVAYGAPAQDKFIYKLKTKYSSFGFWISDLPKVAMGVGGTFDYISGNLPRAPEFMRSLGLEWLYRLIKQPSRIKRIFTAVVVFPILVLFKQ